MSTFLALSSGSSAKATARPSARASTAAPGGLQLSAADIQVLSPAPPSLSELNRIACYPASTTPTALSCATRTSARTNYSETDLYPRPSHADYTYLEKHGIKVSSGGGRSSARETVGRVAAGAIAEHYLNIAYGIEIVASVSFVTRGQGAPPYGCRYALDSIGGTVACVLRNLPSGLGEPVFDKFEAKLAHAMLSILATQGFEHRDRLGVPGSQHNDAFVRRADGSLRTRTQTNWSGGVQGGITNREDVYFRVAFKPPATISQAQATAQYDGTQGSLAARGRHDPCVVPRAVPIVEAMAALVAMDLLLIQKSRQAAAGRLPSITALSAP
ncbi:chorismate synthase [Mycena belliarum]|uniref:chorismate synthase n=1 Tax=Mycena belliarum TaxID=1033014 RepID=A0AAD6XTR3_9AGAR|nr:chorismate synthase [Mycena belliae]